MNGTILAILSLVAAAGQGEFNAGVARKVITPASSIRMSGYADRTQPSQGILHDLWAKAVTLQDSHGERLVIVTVDAIALPREVSDAVAARVMERYGLERRQLMLNVSHTHSGPIIWPNLQIAFEVSPNELQQLIAYRNRLVDDLTAVIGESLANLTPATLAIGHGSAAFAINRRNRNDQVWVDHDVPVLRIAAPDGQLRAVLFGYACHNTTFLPDCRKINGDYAGFAQIELEKELPGVTAMFLMLCGGNQNPEPRGTEELASQHGKTLADAVRKTLDAGMRQWTPTIRTAYEEVKLDVARQDQAVFEQEKNGDNPYARRRAEAMLAAIAADQPIWQVPIPVQVVDFGESVRLLAIGGEVVVDYALRLKRECPQTDLIVAGYTNGVMCYVPSLRVLHEASYEAVTSTIYYSQPGPFAESVEDTLVEACHRLFAKVDAKSPKNGVD